MSAIGTAPSKPHPLHNYVQTQLNSGADEDTIVSELGKSGVEETMARRLIRSVQAEPIATDVQNTASFGSIQAGAMGGALASILSGLVWGGIAILTGLEIGFAAIGVGAACGYGVLLFSKGETSSIHQFIAAGSAIFGILIGKYFVAYLWAKEMVAQELGPETAANMSLFSFHLFGEYLSNLGEFLDGFDLLWLVLAMGAAWKITGSGD